MSRWDVQGELEPRAIPWFSLTNRTARSEIETLQKPQNFLTVGKHVMVYHGFPVFLTLMILGYSHDVFFLVWGVSANKTAQDSWTFQSCFKQPVHLVGRWGWLWTCGSSSSIKPHHVPDSRCFTSHRVAGDQFKLHPPDGLLRSLSSKRRYAWGCWPRLERLIEAHIKTHSLIYG